MPQVLPIIGAIGAVAGVGSTIASLVKKKPQQQQPTGGIGLDSTVRGMEPLSTTDYNQAPQLQPLGQQFNLGNYSQSLQGGSPDLLSVMNQFRS